MRLIQVSRFILIQERSGDLVKRVIINITETKTENIHLIGACETW